MAEEKLVRSNKVTAYWGGGGVAIANFYKTHDKVGVLRSDSEEISKAGFKMPESTDENQVTAQDKLAAFKNFVMANATKFGIQYDPVDRRSDDCKFPNTYNEESFRQYSREIAINALTDVVAKVQTNVIDKMVKSGLKPENTVVDFGIGEKASKVDITESYKNGNLKYAKATYDIVIQVSQRVDGNDIEPISKNSTITIDLVSGQLKKPREYGGGALSTMGLKTFMVDNGLIPKVEKKKEDAAEEGTVEVEEGVGAEDAAPTEAPAEVPAEETKGGKKNKN